MHESGDFKYKEENLNYSQKGLLLTFPKYFTIVELAERYKNNPQKIANRVYANRMGNGDEESGDGWRHRGLTYMMLTGKETQEKVMKDLELTDPEQLKEDRNSMLASGWFWDTRKINLIADKGLTENVIKEVTKKVNGGLIGLAERIEKLNMICDKLQFRG
jgi:putative chitinase